MQALSALGAGAVAIPVPDIGTLALILSAFATLVTAFAALVSACVAAWAAHYVAQQASAARKDLTLGAYANAVREILDVKRSFAENDAYFKDQVERNRRLQMKDYIPEYMRENIPMFLTFASDMWRFSYVYSVFRRGTDLGLTPNECTGLKMELEAWLALPGFRDVYKTHTSTLKAHDPDFLDYLDNFYKGLDKEDANRTSGNVAGASQASQPGATYGGNRL